MLLSGIRSIFTPVATPELKTDGIHKFVRHPLYSGTHPLCGRPVFYFSHAQQFDCCHVIDLVYFSRNYF